MRALIVLILSFLITKGALAKDSGYLGTQTPPHQSYLLAQSDTEDNYDPFADYTEFEESTEEEADINFFRHGRFFVLGFQFGQRLWTGNLSKLYESGSAFGVFFTYFFDLRFALQLGMQLGDYGFAFDGADGITKTVGNVSLTLINVNIKYFLNTQNVTKGLADLNPYLLGGISQIYRTYTISTEGGFGRDATMGIDWGGGVEVPVMRRKSFVGFQFMYHMPNFKDRNNIITLPDGTLTTAKPSGDTFDLSVIFGMNF